MKRFRSFVHKLLLVLAVVTVSVVFERCGEVVDGTVSGMKRLPIPTIPMRTAEPAEVAVPDTTMGYNYVCFRNDNTWVTDELISYKVSMADEILSLSQKMVATTQSTATQVWRT